MGREHTPALKAFKIDISHQEMERILDEIEALYRTTQESGGQWLSIEACSNWLMHELGYEDLDEFHEALHGTFEQFLDALPNVQVGRDERDRPVFKMKPDPPQSEWKPAKLTLKVTDRKDLWNVLLKSPQARVEIPELEFEISEDSKRKIDSIYNHIAAAIFNLGTHVRSVPLPVDAKNKIVDCIMALNLLLDVDTPWTLVVQDPSGLSEFSDMSKVEVGEYEHPVEGQATTEANEAAAQVAALDVQDRAE